VPPDTPEEDERCRSIENGAIIVSVCPSIFTVTLQMPRGNLETIYPRALVVSGIRRYLDRGDFMDAFTACRTHMVDMNILHDYDPKKFLKNVGNFIQRLEKGIFIDEFLMSLK
jgi:elongator complex protein 1